MYLCNIITILMVMIIVYVLNEGFCPASHAFPFCNGAFCCPTSKDTYHGKLTVSGCLGCEGGAEIQCTTSSCVEYGKNIGYTFK